MNATMNQQGTFSGSRKPISSPNPPPPHNALNNGFPVSSSSSTANRNGSNHNQSRISHPIGGPTAPSPQLASPLQPVAPPSKKQKAMQPIVTPMQPSDAKNDFTDITNDAIARRRAELRRLQRQQTGNSSTTDRERLVTRARQLTNSVRGRVSKSSTSLSTAITAPPPSSTTQRSSAILPNTDLGGPRIGLVKTPVRTNANKQPPLLAEEGQEEKVENEKQNQSMDNNSSASVQRSDQKQSSESQNGSLPPTPSSTSSSFNNVRSESQPSPNASEEASKPTSVSTDKIVKGNDGILVQQNKSKRHETFLSIRNGVPSPMHPPSCGVNKNTTAVVPQNGIITESGQSISDELQLVKDLRAAKVQETKLLQRITYLEKETVELRIKHKDYQKPVSKQSIDTKAAFKKMLEIASKDGNDAAVRWAEKHSLSSSNVPAQLSRNDPLLIDEDESATIPLRGRSSLRSSPGRRKRLKSPKPTTRLVGENPLTDNDVASRAVETVEDTYSSDFARFFLRKPYGGNETMYCSVGNGNEEKDNKNVSWIKPVKSYLEHATVQDETTLEVIAKIEADESIMILYGPCNIKHGTANLGEDGTFQGYNWKQIDNIDNMDGALGRIMYIDINGNEGEYWLDPIYEEAIKIRELYCSKISSAAIAFRATAQESPVSKQSQTNNNSPQTNVSDKSCVEKDVVLPKKPSTADKCVGTDNQQIPKRKTPKTEGVRVAGEERQQKQPQRKESVPMSEEDTSGSADALSTFLILFFSSIFQLVTFATIRLPLRIMWFVLKVSIVCLICCISWLYFANDNGSKQMGASTDFQFFLPSMRE